MNKKYYSTKPTLQEDIALMVEVTDEVVNEIRADAIDEVKGLAQHYLIGMMDLENATKYGNKNAKQQDISYGTLMRYEIADCVDDFLDSIERLKI